jgi:catechol 2,3-dioxygenase-like lactoylglutathione lyase family enzyme
MDTASLTKAATPAGKRSALIGPLTRGVHHLALNTDDMRKTIEFYVDVLGMPLVHAMKVPPGLGTGEGNRGNPPYEEIRHYFFDMGNDSLLGFFEIPAGKEPHHHLNAIGAMQHCAFVVTPERLRDIQERLIRHKVPFLGPIPNMPGSIGIYFFDPNNIRLEIDCQTHDGSSPEVIGTLLQTKRQAHAELATLPDVNAEWLKKYTLAMPD